MIRVQLEPVLDWALSLLMVAVNARSIASETYKSTTPMPPGVAGPDKVETRYRFESNQKRKGSNHGNDIH